MGLARLITITETQAADLLRAYWQLRDDVILELAGKARAHGLELSTSCSQIQRSDLSILGQFLKCVIDARVNLLLPTVPDWLKELHDPIDGNSGLSEQEIWLGVATSYVFACALLNTVDGTRLAYGREMVNRYIHQNQPVVKGRWYAEGQVEDASPLAFGQATIRRLKKGAQPDVIARFYDSLVAYVAGRDIGKETN